MNNKFTLKTVYGIVRSNKLYSHNGIRYNLNPVIIDNTTGYFTIQKVGYGIYKLIKYMLVPTTEMTNNKILT